MLMLLVMPIILFNVLVLFCLYFDKLSNSDKRKVVVYICIFILFYVFLSGK